MIKRIRMSCGSVMHSALLTEIEYIEHEQQDHDILAPVHHNTHFTALARSLTEHESFDSLQAAPGTSFCEFPRTEAIVAPMNFHLHPQCILLALMTLVELFRSEAIICISPLIDVKLFIYLATLAAPNYMALNYHF